MSDIQTKFFVFLDERKEEVLAEVNSLASDGRMDESNILKAKLNIYDISRAVFGVAAKATSDDKIKEAFLTKFGNITGQWEATLEKAKAHDDSRQVLIEEAKLSAVSEIRDKINELF